MNLRAGNGGVQPSSGGRGSQPRPALFRTHPMAQKSTSLPLCVESSSLSSPLWPYP